MKRIHRFMAGFLCLYALLGVLPPRVEANAPSMGLTILFTHDTHDHFYPSADGVGGYTRLAAALKEQRQTRTRLSNGSLALYPTVTLDGGDFSMGSLFQTIYATDAPELRALGVMGYDVTTLGNHEFDYRAQGLADMLNAAKASADPLPAVVQANYRTPEDREAGAAVTRALESYPVTDYVILEKEDGVGRDGKAPLRVAVFGVLGLDAHECAPMSGMTFEPIADAAKRVVEEIQEKEEADFIICLSHSGTENGKGEDYELAKAVAGIDVIISGHTHSTTQEPIQVNNTVIVSCGEYTRNLGRLTIGKKVSPDGAVSVVEYKLIPIDDTIAADTEMEEVAAVFRQAVEKDFLGIYGLKYDQVLTTVKENDFTIEQTGNLIGDAYISAVERLEGDQYRSVDFAVVPSGVIRDYLHQGPVTTAQAFDILSLGSGADGTPTYPLVSVYLTGQDLKNAFEVDASISSLMPAAELFGAGMSWTYNPNRMILDKVTDCAQMLESGQSIPLETDKLYRVVADLYSGQMLGAVEGQSFGLLSITPRDENGEPIADLESRILTQGDGSELKAWYALASYLEGQENVIPGAARKIEKASWSPIALLAHPGKPTLAALGALLLALVFGGLLIRFLVRRLGRAGRRSYYRRYRGK